ncbi:MAG: hypothetical protein IJD92_03935 [Bacilli bacterium]|nr:hypothetical protein [Bacilli bacterium]
MFLKFLILLYLSSVFYSCAMFSYAMYLQKKQMKKDGFHEVYNKKSIKERIKNFISDYSFTIIPVINICVILPFFLEDFDELYNEYIKYALNSKSIIYYNKEMENIDNEIKEININKDNEKEYYEKLKKVIILYKKYLNEYNKLKYKDPNTKKEIDIINETLNEKEKELNKYEEKNKVLKKTID